jgi:hypothetical protein
MPPRIVKLGTQLSKDKRTHSLILTVLGHGLIGTYLADPEEGDRE